MPPKGYGAAMWWLAVVVAFPLLLIVGLVALERLEHPLEVDLVESELERFLDTARPDEVETFVTTGFAPALERYWRRRRTGGRSAPAA